MGEKNNKKVKRAHIPYTNRELSWLAFNERVLEEAYEKENPLLERLKFLSITASNLDEFFMVRVAGLREQARMGVKKPYPIGQSPAAQLRQISEQAHFLCQKQYNCLRHSLLPMLRKQDILLVHFNELDAKQKKQIARYFEHTIFPVLTPLAVDQSRPLVESGGAAKKGERNAFCRRPGSIDPSSIHCGSKRKKAIFHPSGGGYHRLPSETP